MKQEGGPGKAEEEKERRVGWVKGGLDESYLSRKVRRNINDVFDFLRF